MREPNKSNFLFPEGKMDALDREHKAWLKMFETISECLGITAEKLNSKECRPMFEMIERWSYYDRERREYLKAVGDWKPEWEFGVFWKGD